jgi:DNA polymerase-3 subunit beta
MELSVPKKDLLKLVTRMQGVAERKSTMPVLSNVLMAVDGPSALRIAATDLYLALVGRVAVDVSKGGSVAVSAKDLLERVRMMPDGPIHLASQDNATTTIKAAGSARRYTLRGMPGDDFPPLPTPSEGSPSLAIDVEVLQELVAKTHFSISSDETRAHLNSALFEWDGDTVRMVTTDGHRLSKMEVKVAGRQASATMLIPLKAIQELRRLGDDIAAEAREGGGSKDGAPKPQLQITQSGSSAFFQGGGMSFAVRLVDAQFPPYSQVIPAQSEKLVRVPRAAFADALRAVSVAASERTGGVKLAFAKGTMRITTESPESGEGFDEIPIDYPGAPMTIGFNAKYFLDVLAALDEDEVQLGLGGELDPAVVRPVGPRQFLAVVMPMRI